MENRRVEEIVLHGARDRAGRYTGLTGRAEDSATGRSARARRSRASNRGGRRSR